MQRGDPTRDSRVGAVRGAVVQIRVTRPCRAARRAEASRTGSESSSWIHAGVEMRAVGGQGNWESKRINELGRHLPRWAAISPPARDHGAAQPHAHPQGRARIAHAARSKDWSGQGGGGEPLSRAWCAPPRGEIDPYRREPARARTPCPDGAALASRSAAKGWLALRRGIERTRPRAAARLADTWARPSASRARAPHGPALR